MRPRMEHILFLTGRLAEQSLRRVLDSMAPAPFTWEVREIGLQVAALMTADMIRRRVAAPLEAARIIVPGRCRGDLDGLGSHFGVPFERGPEELKDLPQFFNREAKPVDLSGYDVAIFAEIVDAPRLAVEDICLRARHSGGRRRRHRSRLPAGDPVPAPGGCVRALKAEGFRVSVDSIDSRNCCAAAAPARTTC